MERTHTGRSRPVTPGPGRRGDTTIHGPGLWRGVLASAPPVDIAHAPAGFDELVEWFDRVSYRLVLLEEYRLEQIESAVAAMERGVLDHLGADASARLPPAAGTGPAPDFRPAHLHDDHVRYATSLEQLRGLLAVVEREDHGGHRQALGQYGRILAESLRRHRGDEKGERPNPPWKP